MKSYGMKQKNYLATLKILTLTSIFTLLIIIVFLLSIKISEINNKKNNLLKYSIETYINITELHSTITSNKKINFDTIKKLKKSLTNSIVNLKISNNQSIFFYDNNSANIINNIEFLWKDMLFDLNSLLDNEEKIHDLFSALEQIYALLMQTKVDCKQLIEEMLVINADTNKISLAQQTIWLAERATNNIEGYIKGFDVDASSTEIFTKDIKTLFNIISSLKNGNSLINSTKIEDKSVITYLSKIDINLQKTMVLFKTIDDKLTIFLQVKSISEAIEQSIIKFNEYLIKFNSIIINNATYNNIFMFIYSSLLLLIIITLLTTAIILKRCYKKNTGKTFDFDDINDYLNKLISDIERLATGNIHLQLTSNNKLTPLTNAINKYTNYIIQHLNKIYNSINSIANLNINSDKYQKLKTNCLDNLTSSIAQYNADIEYFYNKNKKITKTAKYYTTNTEELMSLIDKLATIVAMIDSKTDTIEPNNNIITSISSIIQDSSELTDEIYDNLEIFILNYEIKSYNIDNKTNKITEIKDKIKILKQHQSLISSTLVKTNNSENFTYIISKLKLTLNELLATNKKLLHPHKLITSELASTTDNYNIKSNEVVLQNIELIDKTFSKLLNDKKATKTIINNIETIVNNNS
jgi:hypothetical protein